MAAVNYIYSYHVYTSPPEVVPDESLGETRGDSAIKTRGKVLGCRLYCKAHAAPKFKTGVHWLATLHNRMVTTVLGYDRQLHAK